MPSKNPRINVDVEKVDLPRIDKKNKSIKSFSFTQRGMSCIPDLDQYGEQDYRL
jgi:hypothetical protein